MSENDTNQENQSTLSTHSRKGMTVPIYSLKKDESQDFS